jgi:hypothetical protein
VAKNPIKVVEKPEDKLSDIERRNLEDFQRAKNLRIRFESDWRRNEQSLLDTGDPGVLIRSVATQSGTTDEVPESASDAVTNFFGINYNARNAALIQSQLISNVPAMMTIPANDKDREDREAAQGHEMALHHLRETLRLPGYVGVALVNLTNYGITYIKQIYDKSAGAYERSTAGKIKHIGEIKISVPRVWDIWLDPDATNFLDNKKVWERLHFDYDTAKAFFDDESISSIIRETYGSTGMELSELPTDWFGTVTIYEKWVAGDAGTAYKGTLEYFTEDGRLLKTKTNPKNLNPCTFNMLPKTKTGTKLIRMARLPYSILPYELIPGAPYARSPASKCYKAQAHLNNCMAVVLQTAKNMGVPKIMTTAAVVNKGSLSNDSIQILEFDNSGSGMSGGGSFPAQMQAANTSNDIKYVMERAELHINDQWGISDALLGKQGRETSGITNQTSIQQSNLIRETLFDNYVAFLKDIACLGLSYAVENWGEDKWRMVLGKEDSQTLLKACLNADVEGGYTVYLERNMLIALDPISRQEQLLRMWPVMQAGGMDMQYFLKLFKFFDFRGIYTKFDFAANRAKKNIDFILEEGELPVIYKHEMHAEICVHLTDYVNTYEFEELDEEQKKLVNQLIDKRLDLEASKRAGKEQTPPGMPPAGLPQMQ